MVILKNLLPQTHLNLSPEKVQIGGVNATIHKPIAVRRADNGVTLDFEN
jgi:hypothetical protein